MNIELPEDVYCAIRMYRTPRMYAGTRYLRLALRHRYGPGVKIYKAYGNINAEIEWADVTDQFLDENGKLK